jgi:tetratricopeptide (TPR) repeat protein
VLFRNFLEYFHGQNYIRSAYQKLAWISILKGDTNGYHHFINLAANRGSSKTDEDRQAIHEAKSGQVPGVILLRARLLCDGGYYDRALKEILDNPVGNVVKTKRDLIEYSYRLGRIYHELGNEYRATGFYKQTIRRGKSEPYYFAASAALQLGLLYENTGNYKGADSAYRVCLLTDTPEYRNSIAQKAKAGIARVKNHLP